MTILDLIDNFGEQFGISVDNRDDPYLKARYINGVPLEQVWNNTENNPQLELNSIFNDLHNNVAGGADELIDGKEETSFGSPAK